MAEDTYRRLRRLCLALPEVRETETFGHPTFQAGTRTFAVLDEYRGERCLCFKAAPVEQIRLCRDARFYPAPYGAKHGWTCLRMPPGGRLDFEEVAGLLVGSYRLVALKRMVAALEALPRSRGAGRVGPLRRRGQSS